MNILRPVLLFIGCLHLAAGPSNTLQLFAWASMLIDYSQGRTLSEAVEMTFDGDHPCSLCLAIAEGESERESKPQAPAPDSTTERNHLFPQQQIGLRRGFTKITSQGRIGLTALLDDYCFIYDIPTPPPRISAGT